MPINDWEFITLNMKNTIRSRNKEDVRKRTCGKEGERSSNQKGE